MTSQIWGKLPPSKKKKAAVRAAVFHMEIIQRSCHERAAILRIVTTWTFLLNTCSSTFALFCSATELGTRGKFSFFLSFFSLNPSSLHEDSRKKDWKNQNRVIGSTMNQIISWDPDSAIKAESQGCPLPTLSVPKKHCQCLKRWGWATLS